MDDNGTVSLAGHEDPLPRSWKADGDAWQSFAEVNRGMPV